MVKLVWSQVIDGRPDRENLREIAEALGKFKWPEQISDSGGKQVDPFVCVGTSEEESDRTRTVPDESQSQTTYSMMQNDAGHCGVATA
jgi:hypothetical protein